MNIPDEIHLKAYVAAQDVPFVDGRGNPINGPVPHSAQIEAAVDAAAPFIAAQALKDHATAVVTHRVNATPTFFEGMKFAALLAMDRAFDMEEHQ